MILACYLRLKRAAPLNRFDFVAIISLGEIILCLFVFSLNINQDPRFLLPLIPFAVLLIVYALSQFPEVVQKLFLLLIGSSVIITTAASFGIGNAAVNKTGWLTPPESNRRNAAILQTLVGRLCTNEFQDYTLIFVQDLINFNSNAASFYARLHSLRGGSKCLFHLAAWAEHSEERVLKVPDHYPKQVVIFRTDLLSLPKDNFNLISRELYQSIGSDTHYSLHKLPEVPEIVFFVRDGSASGLTGLRR